MAAGKHKRKGFYEANYGRETKKKRLFSKLIYTKTTARCHASFRVRVVPSPNHRQQLSYLL